MLHYVVIVGPLEGAKCGAVGQKIEDVGVPEKVYQQFTFILGYERSWSSRTAVTSMVPRTSQSKKFHDPGISSTDPEAPY
jgi:hypothetical protein